MNVPKIAVAKIGGGCLKAILLNGQETIWVAMRKNSPAD
jgi:hypothetical protein